MFKKAELEQVSNTSFSFHTIEASTNQLIAVLGNPSQRGGISEKVTREWWLTTDDDIPFTVYDWKEWRNFDDDEVITWHIGTRFDTNHRDRDNARVIAALRAALS